MSKQTTAPIGAFDERLRYPVEEAAAYLKVSRAHLFKRIHQGDIKTIKDGRRLFVPGSEIVRLSSVPQ